jgi:hypothetical protein
VFWTTPRPSKAELRSAMVSGALLALFCLCAEDTGTRGVLTAAIFSLVGEQWSKEPGAER